MVLVETFTGKSRQIVLKSSDLENRLASVALDVFVIFPVSGFLQYKKFKIYFISLLQNTADDCCLDSRSQTKLKEMKKNIETCLI